MSPRSAAPWASLGPSSVSPSSPMSVGPRGPQRLRQRLGGRPGIVERPADVIGNAVKIMRIATGEERARQEGQARRERQQ
jgi:hypothetical protein